MFKFKIDSHRPRSGSNGVLLAGCGNENQK